MWFFKEFESLHSFQLEEDDKSLLFSSNDVANYNDKNNTSKNSAGLTVTTFITDGNQRQRVDGKIANESLVLQ